MRLDLDVEQVGHAQVLRPRHALHRADDGRRARAAQHVAQRESRRQRVRVRFVVQQDQHAVGVGEVALVLLHARAGQRSAEFGGERRREQLGEIEVRDLRHHRPQLVVAAALRHAVERAARRAGCRRRRGSP